jgi:flagellin-like protein
MIINHNMSAMYANRQLGVSGSEMGRNLEKLSSGMRINKAGDDASGLAVSEKMRSQIRGLNQAEKKHSERYFFYPDIRRLSSGNSGYSSQGKRTFSSVSKWYLYSRRQNADSG